MALRVIREICRMWKNLQQPICLFCATSFSFAHAHHHDRTTCSRRCASPVEGSAQFLHTLTSRYIPTLTSDLIFRVQINPQIIEQQRHIIDGYQWLIVSELQKDENVTFAFGALCLLIPAVFHRDKSNQGNLRPGLKPCSPGADRELFCHVSQQCSQRKNRERISRRGKNTPDRW